MAEGDEGFCPHGLQLRVSERRLQQCNRAWPAFNCVSAKSGSKRHVQAQGVHLLDNEPLLRAPHLLDNTAEPGMAFNCPSVNTGTGLTVYQ